MTPISMILSCTYG